MLNKRIYISVKYVDNATEFEEGAYPILEMDGMVSTITTNLQE